MFVKHIVDEDFSNYKKPSMFIGFPYCNFKCEKDCGKQVCQNGTLASAKNINVEIDNIIDRYLNNKITSAIVCGGLEPFDSWKDLITLVKKFRERCSDDIVIYTGYYKDEIRTYIEDLQEYEDIVIKFGRYIPDQEKHYDEVLGIYLASDNQYGERIS